MSDVVAGRLRCVAVATGLTVLLGGGAWVLTSTAARQPPGADQSAVRLCLAALLAAAVWAWLQAMAGVADGWRGAGATARPGGIRRLALAACGVALAGTLAAPAYAGTHGPRPDPLAGLPLPERAQGRVATAPAHAEVVVVQSGDTLWALAERDLGPPVTAQRVSHRWQAIYRQNRGVIGPDPDLIRPGQVLKISEEHR